MLTITRLETFVIGDGPEIDPDKGGIEPLACLRVHTSDGLVGFSEVFRVPLPEKEWTRRFGKISAEELAIHLRACAKHVRPNSYRKNDRGPKKPRPKRTSGKTDHHVSTARLLAAQI